MQSSIDASVAIIALRLCYSLKHAEDRDYGEYSWYYFMEKSGRRFELLCSIISSIGINSAVVPSWSKIFESLLCCPMADVKVVILGQDPYPKKDRATGLSFSQKRGDIVSKSLTVIYNELERSYPNKSRPNHGDLTSWARQGVLLLNTSLTTSPGVPGAHSAKWKEFINQLIEYFNEMMNGQVCYLVWGAHAKKMLAKYQNIKQFIAPHPAERGDNTFSGCNHFVKANQFLTSIGRDNIDWFSICD